MESFSREFGLNDIISNDNIDYTDNEVIVKLIDSQGKVHNVIAKPFGGLSASHSSMDSDLDLPDVVEIKLTKDSPSLFISVDKLKNIISKEEIDELTHGETGHFIENQVHRREQIESVAERIKNLRLVANDPHPWLQQAFRLFRMEGLNAVEKYVNEAERETPVTEMQEGDLDSIADEFLGMLSDDESLPAAKQEPVRKEGVFKAVSLAPSEKGKGKEVQKESPAKEESVPLQEISTPMQEENRSLQEEVAPAQEEARQPQEIEKGMAGRGLSMLSRAFMSGVKTMKEAFEPPNKPVDPLEEKLLAHLEMNDMLTEENIEAILLLGKRITYEKLDLILKREAMEEAEQMRTEKGKGPEEDVRPEKIEKLLRTFVTIGKTIKVGEQYFAEGVYEEPIVAGREEVTYGYYLDPEHVMVNIEKNPLNKGGTKDFSKIVHLDKLNEKFGQLTIDLRKFHDRKLSPFENQLVQKGVIADINLEHRTLRKFHERTDPSKVEPGQDCIAPPFLGRVLTGGEDTLVLIQRRLDGDGTKLLDAAPQQKAAFLLRCASGLAFIHGRQNVHGDVKPQNMLFEEEGDSVKGYITDVGSVTEFGKPVNSGTIAYLAPETARFVGRSIKFNNFPADQRVDSYAFGVSILKMVTNVAFEDVGVPFRMTQAEIDELIDSKIADILSDEKMSDADKGLNTGMLVLAKKLIRQKNKDRITCKEAAEHLEQLVNSFS